MVFYKHINTFNNNKWIYILFYFLYINVNYSQNSVYK